jgi:Tfp pilus assembly protein PilF
VADILERQEKEKEAAKEYEKAVLKEELMGKQEPFIHLYYGKFLGEQNKKQQAAKHFKIVEEIASSSVTVLKSLEKAYKDIGYTKSAARVARNYERIELEREMQKEEMEAAKNESIADEQLDDLGVSLNIE